MPAEHWLVLDLNPEPWRVGPLSTVRRGGKPIPVMGRDQSTHGYKEAVAEAVRSALGTDEALYPGKTKLTIYIWRQMDIYKTPQARAARNQEADATNILKATEDALHKIFYKNDKDNSDVRCVLVEQGFDVNPKVVIHIEEWQGLDESEFPPEVLEQIRVAGQRWSLM